MAAADAEVADLLFQDDEMLPAEPGLMMEPLLASDSPLEAPAGGAGTLPSSHLVVDQQDDLQLPDGGFDDPLLADGKTVPKPWRCCDKSRQSKQGDTGDS